MPTLLKDVLSGSTVINSFIFNKRKLVWLIFYTLGIDAGIQNPECQFMVPATNYHFYLPQKW